MNWPPSRWEMWFVFLLEDVSLWFSLKPPSLPPHVKLLVGVWRLSFHHICISYAVVYIFKGALKHDLPPSERRVLRAGEQARERSKKYRVKRRRSKTEAANSFHTTAGGNLTVVNICQSSIFLNSVTYEGSLVRQLVFVQISGAIMVEKLTYVLLWCQKYQKHGHCFN